MEKIKLFDSELRLMELIWQQNEIITAKQISQIAGKIIGWNKNTTYTVLKKLVGKGAIKRVEPHFRCHPLITKEQVQLEETRNLIDKLYDGSLKMFFSAFLKKEHLSEEEIADLKDIIHKKL